MNIIICDDEKSTLEYLLCILTEHYGSSHKFAAFSDTDEMLSFDESIDILISDIKIGNVNGIDKAKELIKKSPDTKVIFITAYPMEYFEDIFDNIRPFGFVGKPVNEQLLFNHIDKIIALKSINRTIEFSSKGVMYSLPLGNILFIESHGRQKFIHTSSDTYITNISFEEIEPKLNDCFARCHIAYIVNMEYISSVTNSSIALSDNSIVPLSRKYKQDFKNRYFTYKEKTI